MTSCLSSDPTVIEGPGSVRGEWTLSGKYAGANAIVLLGSISFALASTADIGGSYDVTETAQTGVQRRVSGVVSGRVTSTIADFDVLFASMQRRHSGSVKADTLTGTWFDVDGSGAVSATGNFRAVRKR